MSNEEMRDKFEAVYRAAQVKLGIKSADPLFERRGDGEYASYGTAGAWWGWQAALASVVIELPEKMGPFTEPANWYNDAIDECREAIEAAGLKVNL